MSAENADTVNSDCFREGRRRDQLTKGGATAGWQRVSRTSRKRKPRGGPVSAEIEKGRAVAVNNRCRARSKADATTRLTGGTTSAGEPVVACNDLQHSGMGMVGALGPEFGCVWQNGQESVAVTVSLAACCNIPASAQ